MAILSNMQGRDIHLVLKSRAHFHDELGSPDHCSEPPDIKIGGHFRALFAKENVCFKHRTFGVSNSMCLKILVSVEVQIEWTFSILVGRQWTWECGEVRLINGNQ